MSDRSAFIIPKGVSLEQDTQGICIEFEDDIVIQAPVGMPIKRIHSRSGSIRLEIDMDVEEISAPNGSIVFLKDATCIKCQGESIESQGTLTSQEISLSGSMQGFSGLSCEKLAIQGSINIQGESTVEDINVAGSARFGSSLTTQKSFFGADLHIQGDCSGSVITAQGNVRIHGSINAESLLSDKSKIICEQNVQLKLLRGNDIVLKGKDNNITAIQAHEHVSISEGSLNSDVLVAPKVDLHPNTVGKIMIVDVQAPLGPHSIKGCLSPEDIAPLLPNPSLFIQQRGILIDGVEESVPEDEQESQAEIEGEEEIPQTADEPIQQEITPIEEDEEHESESSSEEEQEQIEQETIPIPEEPPSPDVKPSQQEAIFAQAASKSTWEKSFEEELSGIIEEANQKLHEEEEPAVEIIEETQIEETQENFHEENITPLSEYYAQNESSEEIEPPLDAARIVIPAPLGNAVVDDESDFDSDSDDLEMLPMRNIPPLAESKETLYDNLKTQTDKIIADYGEEAPSSLLQMRTLIEAQDYTTLRMEIKSIWSQVLRHHQKKNTRIPGLVTMAFNEINKLLN